ncbi:MAG: hypothetical protein U0T84_10725 [Chitinophagales bacterium]
MQKFTTRFFGVLIASTITLLSANAQTNTFTYSVGPNFNNWHAAGNWSLGHVPTASEDVDIPSTALAVTARIFNGNQGVCRNLTISGNRDLAIEDLLTVNGSISHSGSGNFFIFRDGGRKGALLHVGNGYVVGGSSGGAVFVFDGEGNNNAGYRDFGGIIAGTTLQNIINGGFTVQGTNGVDCYYNYTPYPNVQRYEENHAPLVNGAYYERWISATSPSTQLRPGQGFAFRSDAAGPFNIAYSVGTGARFNDNPIIPVPVSYSYNGTGQGWNLLSNPYPASYEISMSLTPSTPVAYVFSTTGQFSGNYGSINMSGVTSGFLSTPYLAPGQGFFVQSNTNTMFQFERAALRGQCKHLL